MVGWPDFAGDGAADMQTALFLVKKSPNIQGTDLGSLIGRIKTAMVV
jgi:hypothetical protein